MAKRQRKSKRLSNLGVPPVTKLKEGDRIRVVALMSDELPQHMLHRKGTVLSETMGEFLFIDLYLIKLDYRKEPVVLYSDEIKLINNENN
jgi:hypothetical protein